MVRSDAVLGPDRVRAGDVVIAMASSGLHSNGYSLARHVLLSVSGLSLDSTADLGEPLGEVLLTPTRIYARDCLSLAAALDVHAFSHVTGGGLQANLARVLPAGLQAEIDRTTWTPAPIFDLIAARGKVAPDEMERTFNLGVGMVAVVPAADVDRAQRAVEHLHRPRRRELDVRRNLWRPEVRCCTGDPKSGGAGGQCSNDHALRRGLSSGLVVVFGVVVVFVVGLLRRRRRAG